MVAEWIDMEWKNNQTISCVTGDMFLYNYLDFLKGVTNHNDYLEHVICFGEVMDCVYIHGVRPDIAVYQYL